MIARVETLVHAYLIGFVAASINWAPWVSVATTSYLFGNFGSNIAVSNRLNSFTYTYCTASPYATVGLRAQAEIVLTAPYSSPMTLNNTVCRLTESGI
jgi:Flp pilus assembly protein TadG